MKIWRTSDRAAFGETLAGLPGIHLDNFGGGASRPVIRGQTLPRIEILSDEANLFDVSSVSPDHAITTDPLLLDAIEILRGPAASRFGGNATNGAINLIDSRVPKVLPKGGLSGGTELRYGTGGRGDDGGRSCHRQLRLVRAALLRSANGEGGR